MRENGSLNHRAATLTPDALGRVALVDLTGARGQVIGYGVNAGGEYVDLEHDGGGCRTYWRSQVTITEERAA